MKSSFCGLCGKVLAERATFCGNCGGPVPASQWGEQVPPPPPSSHPSAVPTGAPTQFRPPVPPDQMPTEVLAYVQPADTAALPVTVRRPKRWPWIVAAVGILGVAGVVIALLVGHDDGGSTLDATDRSDGSGQTDSSVAEEGTVTTSGDASSPAASSVTTSPATLVTVVVPIAVTTAPAPTTTPVPPTTVGASTSTTVVVPGDLLIAGYPMTKPVCDEQFITVVASAVLPDTYPQAVTDALHQYPGANYLRTDQTCSSLRPSLNGNPIYTIYFGPFVSMSDACAARSLGPADAYVRRLSTAYPSDHVVKCS